MSLSWVEETNEWINAHRKRTYVDQMPSHESFIVWMSSNHVKSSMHCAWAKAWAAEARSDPIICSKITRALPVGQLSMAAKHMQLFKVRPLQAHVHESNSFVLLFSYIGSKTKWRKLLFLGFRKHLFVRPVDIGISNMIRFCPFQFSLDLIGSTQGWASAKEISAKMFSFLQFARLGTCHCRILQISFGGYSFKAACACESLGVPTDLPLRREGV